MNDQQKTEKMREIKEEVLNLRQSFLCLERIKNNVFPVIGEGNHNSEIMFIGEAPGKNEAATGHPFCGQSGKILDELLEGISLSRKDVYITNIVKDRPPANRDPKPEEIEMYAPFLLRQVNIIQPKVIVTLGRFSMEYIMKQFGLSDQLRPISQMHGQLFLANTDYGDVKILPLYHPAVALYNRKQLDTLKKDFEVLRNI